MTGTAAYAVFVAFGLLLLPGALASPDPGSWQVLAEDTPGFGREGDRAGGRDDVSRILLDEGDGTVFRLAVENHAALGPADGTFVVLLWFELRVLRETTAGDWVAGDPVPVRVMAFMDEYSYGTDVQWYIVAGEDVNAQPFRGEPVEGLAEPDHVSWTLRRDEDFAAHRALLPLEHPWGIGAVYAQAQRLTGQLDDAIVDSVSPFHDTVEGVRIDRAPDAGYGRQGTIRPASHPNGTQDGNALVELRGLDALGAVPKEAVVASVALPLLAYLVHHFWGTPLFSRIVRPAALDHQRRRLVHDTIHENPGITFGVLRNVTGIGSGSLAHHVKILEQQGIVANKAVGRRKYLYIATDSKRLPEGPPSDDVVAALERARQATPAELAAALGRPRSTVARRLRFWEATGRIRSERVGRVRRYSCV